MQAAADAQMKRLNRASNTGTITLAKGDPSIRGGQGFVLQGCREEMNGSYLVRNAVHILSKEGGLMTTLDVYSADDDIDFSN